MLKRIILGSPYCRILLQRLCFCHSSFVSLACESTRRCKCRLGSTDAGKMVVIRRFAANRYGGHIPGLPGYLVRAVSELEREMSLSIEHKQICRYKGSETEKVASLPADPEDASKRHGKSG